MHAQGSSDERGEKTPAKIAYLSLHLRIVFFCQQTDVIANQ
jgi:hypothetical protein